MNYSLLSKSMRSSYRQEQMLVVFESLQGFVVKVLVSCWICSVILPTLSPRAIHNLAIKALYSTTALTQRNNPCVFMTVRMCWILLFIREKITACQYFPSKECV